MEALGLEAYAEEFRNKGWGSYGTFAYASSYTPGNPDDSKFLEDVVTKLLGDPDHPKKATLRRLYFESYTVATAELRRRHDRTEEDAPRKIPATEKEARRSALVRRLAPGLVLAGELDPSYGLLDAVCQQHEDNSLMYLDWESCTKREAELTSATKKDKQWKPDASGIIRERTVDSRGVADVSTDLLLRYTLQRRGLAYDIADLMSYESHQKVVDMLLTEYLRVAPDHYAKVSLEQVSRADREIFRSLQEQCREGIRRTLAGDRPMERHIDKILADPRVRLLLMPLARGEAE